MSVGAETIIGSLPIVVKLGVGTENLRLFITERRFLIAHIGKRGLGSLAMMPLLGKLSLGLEDVVKGGGESSKKRRIEELSPEQILAADKDNFYITYDDVIRVELDELIRNVRITILTKEEKFEFFAPTDFSLVQKMLFDALGEKVTANPFG